MTIRTFLSTTQACIGMGFALGAALMFSLAEPAHAVPLPPVQQNSAEVG